MARKRPPPPFNKRRTKSGKVSPRHMAVIDTFLTNDFDQRGAVEAHGYAKGTDPKAVFTRPDVQEEIDARMLKAAEKTGVTVEWVIERLKRIADGPNILARFKKVQDDGSLAWDFTGAATDELAVIAGMTVDFYNTGHGPDAIQVKKFKIDTSDAKAALDSLARHLGMFKDKVEISGESIADLLARGRERLRPAEGADGQE